MPPNPLLQAPKPYEPPAGSLDIPHPRTLNDLLLRSAFIHLCAATTYLVLGRLIPHRCFSPALLPLYLVFPELLALQLTSLAVELLSSENEALVIAFFTDTFQHRLPREVEQSISSSGSKSRRDMFTGEVIGGRSKRQVALWWLAKRAALVLVSGLPLAAALGAYVQRNAIRYHAGTNTGNTGLDHRNGWLAAQGVAATMLSGGALAVMLVLYSVNEDDEGGGTAGQGSGGGGESKTIVRNQRTDSVNGGPSGAAAFGSGAGQTSPNEGLTPNFSALFSWTGDLPTLAAVVCATLIQQILLTVTHRTAPIVTVLRSWPLLLAVLAINAFLVLKRKVQPLPILRLYLIALVVATVTIQAVEDARELHDLTHGIYQGWNYRWQVKDWFSARN